MRRGVVFIPALGYLEVGTTRDVILRAVHEEIWLVEVDGVAEPKHLSRIKTAGKYPFGIIEDATPLFGKATVDVHGHPIDIRSDDIRRTGAPAFLVEALEIVSAVVPQYHSVIEKTTDYFVLLSRADIPSFTAEQLPGVNFLSVPTANSLPYFLEDIAHQCGHTVLSAASFGRQLFFVGDEGASIGTLTGNVRDTRSVYVVLHGLFTEVMITCVLYGALVKRMLKGEAQFEGCGPHSVRIEEVSHGSCQRVGSGSLD